jgi:hypothetical protein
MADSETDTSRAVVKTYVPAYQREEWDDHAEDLGMSRSEFVKSMVQAGRRGFEPERRLENHPQTGGHPESESSVDWAEPTESEQSLEESVLDALSATEYTTWEALLAGITDDIESRLEDTLQELQAADEIRYSGRNGGYTLER